MPSALCPPVSPQSTQLAPGTVDLVWGWLWPEECEQVWRDLS